MLPVLHVEITGVPVRYLCESGCVGKSKKIFQHTFQDVTVSNSKLLWYVDPLLGNYREISRHTTAVAR
jgi:hypothetical protein